MGFAHESAMLRVRWLVWRTTFPAPRSWPKLNHLPRAFVNRRPGPVAVVHDACISASVQKALLRHRRARVLHRRDDLNREAPSP